MIPVDERVYFEHVQVIGCDIKLESVEKCGDVEHEPISFFFFFKYVSNFGNKSRVYPWAIFSNIAIFS
jgi:hypothetical protein